MTGYGEDVHHGGHGAHHDPEKIRRAIEAAKQLPRKPKPQGVVRVAAGLEEHTGPRSRVSWSITHAPYLAIVDIADANIADILVAPNPLADMRGGVGIAIARWLIDNNVDIVVVGHIGHHALEAINAKKIKIVQPMPGETLVNVLRRIGLLA
ncbi:NifB/NifX family molybdenum-iron cluster-binding protein [Hyperthermus butylicus]|uniref:Dinitrogenase iron-molybdenum cofactor biosynthesis domain-containing protein n=1 Tax=Hyperthermus butylicus (strain DSM 5456 / JCM 9403 / PLM1-5) TaxID=415426 RepID=A2BKP1_HYPBU|nr:NifB/NifX family molybdenum-iron cluster-binding protein [Hyperthermus butylicus]ABM80552.1 hypothetical protein Hbut_0697 [Hyperthermus butylicus DSM 5456]